MNGDGPLDVVKPNSEPGTIKLIISMKCLDDGAPFHSDSECFVYPEYMGREYSAFMECKPDHMQLPRDARHFHVLWPRDPF